MPESFPRITLSINRRSDGSRSTGDLNSLCIGFGIFQVWLYLAIFGVSRMFNASELLPWFPYLPMDLPSVVLNSFLIVGGIALIVVGITNQRFLRFYVGRSAVMIATGLCSLGTLLLYTTCIEGIGTVTAMLAGGIMGVGSSLLLAQWGTTFARFQFATIIMNTSVAIVLGMLASVVCANWVPSPISGVITVLLPIISSPILRNLIPTPFYRRNEAPIFRPLEISRLSFAVSLGIPVLIVGISLGALRMICVGEIVPSSGITLQLVIGAACAASIVVYIVAIALSKRDMFWDSLFRFTIPITMLGIGCIPLLFTDFSLLASFCAVVGYICLEVLMWVFFAGLSQEFKLSPIFVFGIGRGLVELGSCIGSALALDSYPAFILGLGRDTDALFGLTIAMMVGLSVGYALMPRYRELKGMTYLNLLQEDFPRTEQGRTIEGEAPKSPSTSEEGPGASAISENPLDVALSDESTTEESEGIGAPEKEKGSFRRKCEEISDQYKLSKREREVLPLLAKGHNAAFIQDRLCISRSTAKTHINHIYKKLDIHTQQELLNMVEDRQRGAQEEAHLSHMGPITGGMGATVAQDQAALLETVRQAKRDLKH